MYMLLLPLSSLPFLLIPSFSLFLVVLMVRLSILLLPLSMISALVYFPSEFLFLFPLSFPSHHFLSFLFPLSPPSFFPPFPPFPFPLPSSLLSPSLIPTPPSPIPFPPCPSSHPLFVSPFSPLIAYLWFLLSPSPCFYRLPVPHSPCFYSRLPFSRALSATYLLFSPLLPPLFCPLPFSNQLI